MHSIYMHCVYAHAWWCMMYTFNAGSITCIYATGGSYCIIKLTREWEMADDDDEVVEDDIHSTIYSRMMQNQRVL